MGLLEYHDNIDAAVPFDYPEFDQPEQGDGIGDEVTLSPELLAAALRPVVEWVLLGSGRHMSARVAVLALYLGIDVQGWRSLSDVAVHFGISRQAVQYTAKRLEDRFGLRWQGGRTDTTRAVCSAAQLRSHAARRNA